MMNRKKFYTTLSNDARQKLRALRNTKPTAQHITDAVGRHDLTAEQIKDITAVVALKAK